jgi:integrase
VRKRRKPAPKRALVLDVRDARLPGGRLTVTSRTRDATQYALRRAAVYALLEDGERGLEILARLKSRKLRIEQVAEHVHAKQFDKLLAEAKAAEAPVIPQQMLGATIDRFLTRVKAKLSEGTEVSYSAYCRGMEEAFGVVRDHRDRIVQDVPVVEVGTEAAEAWLHGEKDTVGGAWSPSTQTVAHAVAHQVWQLAIEADEERAEKDGLPRTLTRNLFGGGRARIRPPKIRKTRVVFLTRQQAGRLLWAARNRPSAALFACGLYAGMRAGEIVNLRLVDLRGSEIHVQPREGRYRWRPKSDNSVREIPMNRPLARWIRAHRKEFAGKDYLIHPANADRPISPKTRERWVVEAFGRAGIEYGRNKGQGATLHTLRHTFASWLAQQDVQLLKIAALMGDTYQTVEETYAHLLPRDLRGAVDRLLTKPR